MSQANPRCRGSQYSNRRFFHKKRQPVKPAESKVPKVDVNVTPESNFKEHLGKLEKLWSEGQESIIIQAIGAAIPRTINLALKFQKDRHDSLELDVSTSTVNLSDNLDLLSDDTDYETIIWRNSSLCITVIRKNSLKSETK